MIRLRIGDTWDGAPIGPEEAVDLEIHPEPDALVLKIDAPCHGDPPPTAPPGPTWALWEHEVVELFVLGPDDTYTEIELGPHGHHLVLQLQGRRQIVARELPIQWTTALQGSRWRGEARLPRSLLPPGPHRWNATAIHGQGETRRYLAAFPMPGPAPDFHRLDAFVAVDLG